MEQHRCYGCMKMHEEPVCPYCGYGPGEENTANQLPAGTVLQGKYLVGKALGQGGFGITYIGLDRDLDRVVAIKEFFPSAIVNREIAETLTVRVNAPDLEGKFRQNSDRFLKEAKALAKLSHIPEIVNIQGFFEENNTAYIVMEYVQGTDLRHFVRKNGGKLDAAILFPMLDTILQALHQVHRAGLVHRDISPDNIMILPDGGIKLLDFGAVRDAGGSDADIDLSHSTEAILKHGFAPMEQYRSRGNLGPWTDEYGVCSSVYYCLTGCVPPDAPARAMGEADVDWDAVSNLQSHQRAALKKGMAMRAKDRFGNLEDLRKALNAQTRPENEPDTAEETSVTLEKKKGKGGLLAAGILLAAVVGGLALLSGGKSAPEPDVSVSQTQAETQEVFLTDSEETEGKLEATESVTIPAEESLDSVYINPSLWQDNVIMRYALGRMEAMGVARDKVTHVTYLDTLADAPDNAVDVSVAQDGRVLGWVDWNEGCHIYYGAEGGINAGESCAYLFNGCVDLRVVEFGTAFHTDETVDMSLMFRGCSSLESVDAQNLNTASVTNMESMFNLIGDRVIGGVRQYYYNETLEYLDFSTWDVSKVENMAFMFQGTHALRTVNFRDWDVSSVKSMRYMFGESGMMDFSAENWVLPEAGALDMSHMFDRCYDLISVRAGNWNTMGVGNMSNMFAYCRSLEALDASDWDLRSLTDMSAMFLKCAKLSSLDVSRWNVGSVQNMSEAFRECASLQELDVSSWDVSSVETMANMFRDCSALTLLPAENWDVSRVKDMEAMFSGTAIFDAQVRNWNVSEVTNMKQMFHNCVNLTQLDLSGWQTKKTLQYEDFCSEWTKVGGGTWRDYFWGRK